jgi:hypothetical protein
MDTKTRRGPSGKGSKGYRVMAFPFGERSVEVALDKAALNWTCEVEGKRYGGGVKVDPKKTEELVAAAFQLAINAVETLSEIDAD